MTIAVVLMLILLAKYFRHQSMPSQLANESNKTEINASLGKVSKMIPAQPAKEVKATQKNASERPRNEMVYEMPAESERKTPLKDNIDDYITKTLRMPFPNGLIEGEIQRRDGTVGIVEKFRDGSMV